MSDTYLFTPDLLEDLAIETIGHSRDGAAGILYHLAKLERARGLRPRTLERPKTISHMANPEAASQLSGDELPSVTFMCSGARAEAERTEDDTLNLAVTLAVRVNVAGQAKRDTLRRRDWLAFAVIECLMQRLPRHGLVSRLDLFDFEPIEHTDDRRIRGEYSLSFNAAIPDAISLPPSYGLDYRASPAGSDPYGPPTEPPAVESITPGIVKVPLHQDV